MSVNRERNGFSRQETLELVPDILQHTTRRLGHTCMGAALQLSARINDSGDIGAYLSPDKVGSWIMQECFQHGHQRIFILAQQTKADFACSSERPWSSSRVS